MLTYRQHSKPGTVSLRLHLFSAPCPAPHHRYIMTGKSLSDMSFCCMIEPVAAGLLTKPDRKQLFTRKYRTFDSILPTRDAMLQHVKCTAYQAGHIAGQALIASPLVSSTRHWGWITDTGEWRLLWTTLPEITKSCRELVKCGCIKGCRGGCGCRSVSLPCVALCACQEECENQWITSICQNICSYIIVTWT